MHLRFFSCISDIKSPVPLRTCAFLALAASQFLLLFCFPSLPAHCRIMVVFPLCPFQSELPWTLLLLHVILKLSIFVLLHLFLMYFLMLRKYNDPNQMLQQLHRNRNQALLHWMANLSLCQVISQRRKKLAEALS
jgi:hypothetical protein